MAGSWRRLAEEKTFLANNKKKIAGATNVLINELGKYMKKKSNKYVNVKN